MKQQRPFTFGRRPGQHRTSLELKSNAMLRALIYLLFAALPFVAAGQKCAEMYDYFKVGATLEYTHYDKRDKVVSVMTQRVTQVEEVKDTLTATFEITTVDDKGKNETKSTVPMKCIESVIYMDMRSIIPPAQDNEQAPDIQMEMKGTDLTFPSTMEPGQTLPDAEMQLIMRTGGMQLMNMRYLIKNRKVEAKETATTKAGEFASTKISYDFEYKLLGTRSNRTEAWFSPAVGTVKSVSYDKNGKVESRMELTKYIKG